MNHARSRRVLFGRRRRGRPQLGAGPQRDSHAAGSTRAGKCPIAVADAAVEPARLIGANPPRQKLALDQVGGKRFEMPANPPSARSSPPTPSSRLSGERCCHDKRKRLYCAAVDGTCIERRAAASERRCSRSSIPGSIHSCSRRARVLVGRRKCPRHRFAARRQLLQRVRRRPDRAPARPARQLAQTVSGPLARSARRVSDSCAAEVAPCSTPLR